MPTTDGKWLDQFQSKNKRSSYTGSTGSDCDTASTSSGDSVSFAGRLKSYQKKVMSVISLWFLPFCGIGLSTSAVVICFITVPMLCNQLGKMKLHCEEEMAKFKDKTDAIWSDMMEIRTDLRSRRQSAAFHGGFIDQHNHHFAPANNFGPPMNFPPVFHADVSLHAEPDMYGQMVNGTAYPPPNFGIPNNVDRGYNGGNAINPNQQPFGVGGEYINPQPLPQNYINNVGNFPVGDSNILNDQYGFRQGPQQGFTPSLYGAPVATQMPIVPIGGYGGGQDNIGPAGFAYQIPAENPTVPLGGGNYFGGGQPQPSFDSYGVNGNNNNNNNFGGYPEYGGSNQNFGGRNTNYLGGGNNNLGGGNNNLGGGNNNLAGGNNNFGGGNNNFGGGSNNLGGGNTNFAGGNNNLGGGNNNFGGGNNNFGGGNNNFAGGSNNFGGGNNNQQSFQANSACPLGPSGPPGQPGLDGLPGYRGMDGLPGKDGITGMIHDPYDNCIICPSGPQGPLGSPGQQGRPGFKGRSGQAGKPGNPGLSPSNGGPNGKKGNPGRDGRPGQKGQSGRPGVVGKGIPGPKGRSGPRGLTGKRGVDGFSPFGDGQPGNTGTIGLKGRRGNMGPPGGQGDTGGLGRPGYESRYCPCPQRVGDQLAGPSNVGGGGPSSYPQSNYNAGGASQPDYYQPSQPDYYQPPQSNNGGYNNQPAPQVAPFNPQPSYFNNQDQNNFYGKKA